MSRLLKAPIRILAFLRKELSEILRQPQLIFGLILGPFAILLLVGLGFQDKPREFRTLFVVPQESELSDQIQNYATDISPQIIHVGNSPDVEAALNRLEDGRVDMVIQIPRDPMAALEEGERATFTFYSNEVDPFQASYVDYFGQVFIGEVNRRVVQLAAEQGQQESVTLEGTLEQTRATAAALESALRASDEQAARLHREDLTQQLTTLRSLVGATAGLAGNLEDDGATEEETDPVSMTEALLRTSRGIEVSSAQDAQGQADEVAEMEQALATLQDRLDTFQRIPASVLVSPFDSEVRNVARTVPDATAFFVGPVMALLLQHLALTFAALSIVRDEQLGVLEMFRVSPLSAGELLLGKLISHAVLAGVIGLILTLVSLIILNVPLLGDPLHYTMALAALIFASLTMGFTISLVSDTDSQAVQYSMIMLLASVFFSGLIIPLESLLAPVRAVAWALPATYGVEMLETIMLRGRAPDPLLLGGLALIGVVFLFVALLLAKRRLAPQ